MSRIEALIALRDKVRAGECRQEEVASAAFDVQPMLTPWRGVVGEAYSGSLDAALALHEAVLPEWEIVLWQESDYRSEVRDGKWRCRLKWVKGSAFKTVGDYGREAEGQDDTPARAWLLAILEALIAKEQGT